MRVVSGNSMAKRDEGMIGVTRSQTIEPYITNTTTTTGTSRSKFHNGQTPPSISTLSNKNKKYSPNGDLLARDELKESERNGETAAIYTRPKNQLLNRSMSLNDSLNVNSFKQRETNIERTRQEPTTSITTSFEQPTAVTTTNTHLQTQGAVELNNSTINTNMSMNYMNSYYTNTPASPYIQQQGLNPMFSQPHMDMSFNTTNSPYMTSIPVNFNASSHDIGLPAGAATGQYDSTGPGSFTQPAFPTGTGVGSLGTLGTMGTPYASAHSVVNHLFTPAMQPFSTLPTANYAGYNYATGGGILSPHVGSGLSPYANTYTHPQYANSPLYPNIQQQQQNTQTGLSGFTLPLSGLETAGDIAVRNTGGSDLERRGAHVPGGAATTNAAYYGLPNMAGLTLNMNQMSLGAYTEKTAGELMLEELRNKMKASPNSPSAAQGLNQRSTLAGGSYSSKNVYEEVGIQWSLKDIKGFVYDFARDQFGSRFIQYHLEKESVPQVEKEELFAELKSYTNLLCKDVFGNYVVQKLLDIHVGTKEQHNFIYRNAIKNHMYELSTHMYGCRVIQKLVEQIFGYTTHVYREQTQRGSITNSGDGIDDDIYDMKTQDPLLLELRQDVLSLVTDQNGNHVIQKCIEQIRPIKRLGFFFDSFKGEYVIMSKHPYGCRVVQRVLENTNVSVIFDVISEVMRDLLNMISDQYANYVVQHFVEHQHQYDSLMTSANNLNNTTDIEPGPELKLKEKELIRTICQYREQLFEVVAQNVLPFSQHKFGSNVVECCLKFGSNKEKDKLIDKMLENNTLIMMMKDPYANYVVQKVIDKANQAQVNQVISIVQLNEGSLRRLTYGKHIINKLKSMH